MKRLQPILHALVAGAAFVLCMNSAAFAADVVLKGDEKCMTCHSGVKANEVLPMALTRHAVKADGRTPSCTNCHGASDRHMGSGGSDKPDRVFKGAAKSSPDEINGACLTCHQSGKRMHWSGSRHESENLACTNCHSLHTPQDKVLTKATQPEVCFTCHKTERAQTHRISHHPILEGKVVCSDCHNPHGSTGPKLLVEDSVNETCYTCHSEKRGPFLWEHAPVTDDCTNCHTPHGSTNSPLLKVRPPWLCQQCHSGDHGKNLYSGANLPDGNVTTINGRQGLANQGPQAQANARACLNCHVLVHGSNHPAGAKFQR
ncbi:MAG: DmsE family decaheme c-type cytochrome [Usitatibacter sp.]